MPNKPTLILIPMIFGLSLWYRLLAIWFRLRGYRVFLINPYVGQAFRQPFFATLVSGNEKEKLDQLAARFDHGVVHQQIKQVIDRSRKTDDHTNQRDGQSKSPLVLLGSSLGGVFAFEYALAHPNDVDKVIAWYPNLIFPDNFIGPAGKPKVPPDLTKLQTTAHIFIGENDSKLQPKTVALAKQLAENQPNITIDCYPKTDHAFFEATIQYCFPNPYFRAKQSKQSLKKTIDLLADFLSV